MTQTIETTTTTRLSRGFSASLQACLPYLKKNDDYLGCAYIQDKALYATDGFILLEIFDNEFPTVNGPLTVPAKLNTITLSEQQGNVIRLTDAKGNKTTLAVDTASDRRYPQASCSKLINDAKAINTIMLHHNDVAWLAHVMNTVVTPKKSSKGYAEARLDMCMAITKDQAYVDAKVIDGGRTLKPLLTIHTGMVNTNRSGDIHPYFNVELFKQAINTFNDLQVREITMWLNESTIKPCIIEGYSDTLKTSVRVLIMPVNRG